MFQYTSVYMIPPKEDYHIESMTGTSDCKHTHDFLELVYMRNGSMTHILEDKPFLLTPGMLLVCLPGQTHSFFTEQNKTIEYINILIKTEFAAGLNSFFKAAFETPTLEQPDLLSVVTLNKQTQEIIEQDMDLMLEKYNTKSANYKEFLRSQIAVLLSICERRNNDPSLQFQQLNCMYERILETLEKDSKPSIPLGDLASDLNYDSCYLTKNFKQSSGLTITDYLQQKRLDMARFLLWSSDMPIDEICQKVGYTNKSFFYKLFKQYMGATPKMVRTTYRKRARRFLDK